jgi:hypothetical protein
MLSGFPGRPSAGRLLQSTWVRGWLLALVVFAVANCTAAEKGTDISFSMIGGVSAGGVATLQLSGPTGQPGEFKFPSVNGLVVNGTGADPHTKPPTYNFFVTPAHAGDYTIPAFYIHSDDGQVFHVLAYTLHVTNQ